MRNKFKALIVCLITTLSFAGNLCAQTDSPVEDCQSNKVVFDLELAYPDLWDGHDDARIYHEYANKQFSDLAKPPDCLGKYQSFEVELKEGEVPTLDWLENCKITVDPICIENKLQISTVKVAGVVGSYKYGRREKVLEYTKVFPNNPKYADHRNTTTLGSEWLVYKAVGDSGTIIDLDYKSGVYQDGPVKGEIWYIFNVSTYNRLSKEETPGWEANTSIHSSDISNILFSSDPTKAKKVNLVNSIYTDTVTHGGKDQERLTTQFIKNSFIDDGRKVPAKKKVYVRVDHDLENKGKTLFKAEMFNNDPYMSASAECMDGDKCVSSLTKKGERNNREIWKAVYEDVFLGICSENNLDYCRSIKQ